jgi:hypothetical protein
MANEEPTPQDIEKGQRALRRLADLLVPTDDEWHKVFEEDPARGDSLNKALDECGVFITIFKERFGRMP